MDQTEGVGPCGSADCFCGPELERLRAIEQRARAKADAPRRLDGAASWDTASYILGERSADTEQMTANRNSGMTHDFSDATRIRNRVTGTVRNRVPGTDDWTTSDFPGHVVTTSQLEALAEMEAIDSTRPSR